MKCDLPKLICKINLFPPKNNFVGYKKCPVSLTLIIAFAVIRKRVAFSFTNLSFANSVGLSSTSWSSTMERCKAEPCLPTRSLQVCRSSSLAFSGLMFSALSLLESSSSSKRNMRMFSLWDKQSYIKPSKTIIYNKINRDILYFMMANNIRLHCKINALI